MKVENIYIPDRPYIKSAFLSWGENGYGRYINLILIDNSIVKFNWRAKRKWLNKLDFQYL